ncbi:MAG: ribose 5-phosphate isomerase B [Clostridia bacterium]|nr:ribose 5-phosphate isomerase B [Clostridia bacterium]
MKIAFGCDHRGFILKDAVINHIKGLGHEVVDFGCFSSESVNYPVYGEKVGRAVSKGECDFGVLICGTGFGISLAANRVNGIRAVNCSDTYTARLTRMHNNANVISIGSMVVGEGLALQLVETFLSTSFEGGRHLKRLEMVDAIEP